MQIYIYIYTYIYIYVCIYIYMFTLYTYSMLLSMYIDRIDDHYHCSRNLMQRKV